MASLDDLVTDVRNGARPNTARVSVGRSAGGGTLSCDNLIGWPTDSKVHFVTYQIDSQSVPVAGTQMDCVGIVSGNDIGSFTVIDPASDIGNSVNDVVEMLPTAAWGQDIADALTASHDRLGAPKAGITYPASTFTTPTIASFTNATHNHTNAAGGGTLGAAAVPALDYSAQTLSNPYKFSIYRNAALTSTNSASKVSHDTELFDTNNNVTTATYTVPVNGFYFFTATAGNTLAAATPIFSYIYKNGAEVLKGSGEENASGGHHSTVTGLLQLSAGNTIEHYFVGGSASAMEVGQSKCYFQGFLLCRT